MNTLLFFCFSRCQPHFDRIVLHEPSTQLWQS